MNKSARPRQSAGSLPYILLILISAVAGGAIAFVVLSRSADQSSRITQLVSIPVASLCRDLGETWTGGEIRYGRYGEPGHIRYGGISYHVMSAIQTAPASVAWNVNVPEQQPHLEFMVGYACNEDITPGPITVRVTVETGGRRDVLFEQVFWVRYFDKNFSYFEKRLPLENYAGESVKFIFESITTDASPAGVLIQWGNPTVYTKRSSDRPRVVLICMDALRADRVGYYNPDSKLMPSLQALAADGVVFKHAISQSPWTLPSVATVLTGLPPSLHRAGKRIPLGEKKTFEELSEAEKKLGLLISESDFILSKLPKTVATLPQLLDSEYLCHMVNGNIVISEATSIVTRFPSYMQDSSNGIALTQRAVEWLNDHCDARFMLYVHYMEPHEWPSYYHEKYSEDTEFNVPRCIQTYDCLVRQGDSYVGYLIEHLKRLGIYDSSLIIFYADHGEHLFEGGPADWGHGGALSNLLLEVPLIVKFPHSEYAGGVVDDYVRLADVFYTILDETGIRRDRRHAWGVPLREVVEGRASGGPAGQVISEYMLHGSERLALQKGDFRLIYDLESKKYRLVDSATDDRILLNSSAQVRRIFSELQSSLESYLELAKRSGPEFDKADFSDEELEQLRQIGYIH